ncbi:MAG: hypothetical protein AAF950_07060 [Pseudomonadota bacterium]
MSWFEDLVGFTESDPETVRRKLILEGSVLRSTANERSFICGRLEVSALQEIKARRPFASSNRPQLRLSEQVGDVAKLHREVDNAGALFQAASQFNLLEMASPNLTPEHGVGIYERDHTQGPACAISCGAGTIFRNYFVDIDGQIGQSSDRQVDCLSRIGKLLDNDQNGYWRMQNGYAFATEDSLDALQQHLSSLPSEEIEDLERQLCVGIQWDTEVTTTDAAQLVSQVYCSALPIGYSIFEPASWEPFARLILRATYGATFGIAASNASRTGNNRVFLTLVGGGVFGNPPHWIEEAILAAAVDHMHYDLDCRIVSYGRSNDRIQKLVQEYEKSKAAAALFGK